MARAFVAIEPPPDVLDAVAALVAPLTADDSLAGARFTRREQWHVTLQFLGNRVDVEAVTEALQALAVPAFELRLAGAGGFGSARRARVLWVGVDTGRDECTALATAVGALLGPAGYEPEQRAFHAHLTLARLDPPRDLRAVVEGLGDRPVGRAFPVSEVVLFESHLRRTGALYEAIARFPLVR